MTSGRVPSVKNMPNCYREGGQERHHLSLVVFGIVVSKIGPEG